jgi:hypothetical protein
MNSQLFFENYQPFKEFTLSPSSYEGQGPMLGEMKTARTPRNFLFSVLSKLHLGQAGGLIPLGYTD